MATKDESLRHHSSGVRPSPLSRVRVRLGGHDASDDGPILSNSVVEHNDVLNYALLIALYTLQGIPMGLSASIPFLIQQKVKLLASAASGSTASVVGASVAATGTAAATAARLSYNANAIFALCSWPFSLKLLWAPLVDAVFFPRFGRRKSWLIPVQAIAGLLMVSGAGFVEKELGMGAVSSAVEASMNVKGLTAFFFALYFLMATQDVAVDGWALTMLSKKNRGRGPICNSIGQNIGYFLSFVGFLALNDVESSESLWRPLLRLRSRPGQPMVSLGGFIRFMGYFMLVTTTVVALFKKETPFVQASSKDREIDQTAALLDADRIKKNDGDEEAHELDASEIGLKETYHRLWAVCQLPAVRWLFLILLTYRLPTALSDNVKFLKAVEFGLSKSTTALLSPTVILPLGILVPIVATKIWHRHPLKQFMAAYKLRVTLVPLIDIFMLLCLQRGKPDGTTGLILFWGVLVLSTALQAIVNSLQFNAQMTFFAHRVDPAIGGSYMTLLNTAANLGGTWPASLVMWLVSRLTVDPVCSVDPTTGNQVCSERGRDPFFVLQLILSGLGCLWIALLGKRVEHVAALPDDAWRTHLLDDDELPSSNDEEQGWSQAGDLSLAYQPSKDK